MGSTNGVTTNPMLFASSLTVSDFGSESVVRIVIVLALRSLIALLLLEEGGDQLNSDIAKSGQAAEY